MTFNSFEKVACEPFKDTSVKTEAVGEGKFKAHRITNTKRNLVPLKVLANCLCSQQGTSRVISAGTTVWVRASDYAQPWASEVLSLEGLPDFIFVPVNRVEFHDWSVG